MAVRVKTISTNFVASFESDKEVDPFSRLVFRIRVLYEKPGSAGGEFHADLAFPATAFIVAHEQEGIRRRHLVTCWHCLAGRNSFTGANKYPFAAALPSHVQLELGHLGFGDLNRPGFAGG